MSLRPAWLYRVCRELLRHTWGRLHPVEVQGLEHLPPRGPAVLCPKHQRWEDILVLGLAMPPPLYYIAKAELFVTPFQREFLLALGGIPLNRQNPRRTLSSLRRLLPLLQSRAYLVLFPEGTYVPGRVGAGRHRLIQLILSLQQKNGFGSIPFVPVSIRYESRRGFSRFAAKVRVGQPLSAPAPEAAPILTQALMAEIARLGQFPLLPESGS